jgi:hypothetical protein
MPGAVEVRHFKTDSDSACITLVSLVRYITSRSSRVEVSLFLNYTYGGMCIETDDWLRNSGRSSISSVRTKFAITTCATNQPTLKWLTNTASANQSGLSASNSSATRSTSRAGVFRTANIMRDP